MIIHNQTRAHTQSIQPSTGFIRLSIQDMDWLSGTQPSHPSQWVYQAGGLQAKQIMGLSGLLSQASI